MAARFNFDRIADTYEETRRLPPQVLDWLAEQLAEAFGSGPVLDAGVGTGRYAEALEARGFQVTGLDVSARMLGQARARGLRRLVLGDVAAIPFRPASFDHAIAFGILHFLPNWGEAIREIARVIRTLVASTTGGMRDTEVGSRYVSALRAHGWEAVEQPGLSADGLAQRVSPTLRFPKIVHESEEATDALIDRFDNRVFTWQWEIPDGIHAAAMAGLRDAFGGRTFRTTRTWELLVWRAEDLRSL